MITDVGGLLLPAGLQAPGVAREHLRTIGAEWEPGVLTAAVLLTSEVVSNAVLHGSPPVRLQVLQHDDVVRIEVRDGGTASLTASALATALSMPSGEALGGRGLPLLHLLARSWGGHLEDAPATAGVGEEADSGSWHVVWFELERSSLIT